MEKLHLKSGKAIKAKRKNGALTNENSGYGIWSVLWMMPPHVKPCVYEHHEITRI